MAGKSNVTRLVDAGILDAELLTDKGRKKINDINLTDDEIQKLKSFQNKLKLDPLSLREPKGPGPWQL